jgi:hypothetical protein
MHNANTLPNADAIESLLAASYAFAHGLVEVLIEGDELRREAVLPFEMVQ